MILLIDNYDSFTHNLYQQVGRFGFDLKVVRNDELTLSQIKKLAPNKLILSPGPKTPVHSGVSIPLIRTYMHDIPILGVCLGHQCLGVAFGSDLQAAKQLLFGKTSLVERTDSQILSSLPKHFEVARYHALVLDKAPHGFRVTSRDQAGDIMSIEHESLPVFGVQFHPESFLMDTIGDSIMGNFLNA